jgi:hypothetical protein
MFYTNRNGQTLIIVSSLRFLQVQREIILVGRGQTGPGRSTVSDFNRHKNAGAELWGHVPGKG